MSRPILLKLARESIAEVLEARRIIDKDALLAEHPVLSNVLEVCVNVYVDNELRSSAKTISSVIDGIIYCAKKAVFEPKNQPLLKLSEYFSCEIEVVLTSDEHSIRHRDKPIIQEK